MEALTTPTTIMIRSSKFDESVVDSMLTMKPALSISIGPTGEIIDSVRSSVGDISPIPTLRVVRGSRMRTVRFLFDEVAAALQFPWYFGANWDAFDECLNDVESLGVGGGPLVILVTEAEQILLEEPERCLAIFIDLLSRAATEWAQNLHATEDNDHRSLPFRVIFQTNEIDAPALRGRLENAGADLHLDA